MHCCANIHNDVCKFTGLQHGSIEQHVEMYVTRRKHDNNDMRKIRAWFNKHIPFDSNNSLRSFSLGLSATENNNLSCNDAESVGKDIHAVLHNVCVENAKIRLKDQVKTLEYLRLRVKIDSTYVHIDSLILFTRLTGILQRETDSVENFDFKPTPESASFFKEGIL